MVVAYVLITVKHGTNKEAVEKLMQFKEVKEAHILYGQYDVIIKIEIENMKDLDQFILKKLKVVPNVESTETLISGDVV